MFNIRAAVEKARRSGVDVWIAGAATLEEVELLERSLGKTLPGEYRDFLLSFGSLSLHASEITGIIENSPLSLSGSSAYGETLYAQRQQGLPDGLLVLQPDAEAPYCLDLRESSLAAPVVCYEVHSKFVGQVASSFEDWLAKFIF